MTDPLAGDGCTLAPDAIAGQSYAACCAGHDWFWWAATSWQAFFDGNFEFFACLWQINAFVATIYFAFVMTVGAVFFAFGPKKPKP